MLKWISISDEITHHTLTGSVSSLSTKGYSSLKESFLPRTLYVFPGAAVTNNHKLGGLKQQKCILSRFGGQKSKIGINGPKSRYQQGYIVTHLGPWTGSSIEIDERSDEKFWQAFAGALAAAQGRENR